MIYYHQPRSEVFKMRFSDILEDYEWAVARNKAMDNTVINNKNTNPPPDDNPNETQAERNRRLVLSMMAQQKADAQRAGGRNVIYE
jgi:hypothetical protein